LRKGKFDTSDATPNGKELGTSQFRFDKTSSAQDYSSNNEIEPTGYSAEISKLKSLQSITGGTPQMSVGSPTKF